MNFNKKKFRAVDLMTLIFLLLNIIYLIIGWDKVEKPFFIAARFVMIAALILILHAFSRKNRLLEILYDWYPLFFFGFYFNMSSIMNRILIPEYLDPFFQKIDQLMFGYQPAIIWGTVYDNLVLQELFHFGYFTFYLMIPGLALYLYLKQKHSFHQFIFVISFIFYLCYLIYNVLPVVGGRYLDYTVELTKIYRYGIFTRIMAFIYNLTPHWGGAVPSSHVAGAIGVTLSIRRYLPGYFYLFVILTTLLSLSTVYCHYHYFIDVICGLIFGMIAFKAGIILSGKFNICSI